MCVQLLGLPGFGPKKVQNILDAVDASRHQQVDVLLFALGIPGIGQVTAKLLVQSCGGSIMVWLDLTCHTNVLVHAQLLSLVLQGRYALCKPSASSRDVCIK